MLDKEIELNKELMKPIIKPDEQQAEIAKQINNMLAYGSVNLGLNNINKENYSEKRIKEDLKK